MSLRIVSGRWHFRFFHGREYTGSTKLKATEANREKAEKVEARARLLAESGQGDTLRIRQMQFSAGIEEWLKWAEGEHREHPATAVRLRSSSTSLKLFFGRLNVAAVTAGKIEDYKTWRRTAQRDARGKEIEPVREITLRHDLHALSGFLRYARKHRWLTGDPLEDVDIPSDKDAVRIHPLTTAEESLYFAKCQERKAWDLHDLGRLMLGQGCRPEEFLELRWEAVNLEAGSFRIASGKSNAAKRTLRMTQETREILARRYQSRKGSPWVFPSPRKPGEHLGSVQSAHEGVIAEVKAALGTAFVVYDLRHSAASRWAEAGIDIATIAAWLGHANLRSVQKYIHISKQHQDEQMRRFDEMQRAKVAPVVEQAPGGIQ